MCSNNASPSWERGAGRNEPEKNMAQLRCHLSLSCEKLKGHCGIVFFFEENHCEFLTDAMVKALLDRAATGYDVVDC